MKVFKFYDCQYHYGIAAMTQQEAETEFNDQVGPSFDKVEEIPETEWDNPFIKIHEDNDEEKESYAASIRELMVGEEPQLLFTNDNALID
jgi:hypothetical protein